MKPLCSISTPVNFGHFSTSRALTFGPFSPLASCMYIQGSHMYKLRDWKFQQHWNWNETSWRKGSRGRPLEIGGLDRREGG